MKIGFYAWNPFQIYQVESIVRHLPGAEYIIEKRGNIDFDRVFTPEFLSSLNAPVHFISRGDVEDLDARYDAIVCQTAFGRMEDLKRAKIIGMQYSMSKERHQYGAWRALCDLNLVYGQYSYDRISPFSPAVMVGNPRFDRWFDDALDADKKEKIKSRLDPEKKTILYLPTWGGLSSIENFGAAVAALNDKYNVIAKVHHKTDTHELSKKNILGEEGIRSTFGAADDLLYLMDVADVVLSDYSGAIFDAINVGKPVILLQQDPESVVGVEKFDLESIEYARRGEIGAVVSTGEALAAAVGNVLEGKSDYRLANKRLCQESFSLQSGAGKTAAAAIADFFKNPPPRSQYQIYLRDDLCEYRRKEERFKKIEKYMSPIRKMTVHLPKTGLSKYFLKEIKGYGSEKHEGFFEAVVLKIKNPWIVKAVYSMTPSKTMLALVSKYDSPETIDRAVLFSRLCFEKSKSVGLAPYIKILAKYGRQQEMEGLIDLINALPVERRAGMLARLERLAEAAKAKIEDVRQTRHAVHDFIVARIAPSQLRLRNKADIRKLISNRFLSDVRQILPDLALSDEARAKFYSDLRRSEERMGKWYPLADIANLNHRPGLKAEDFICWHKGASVPVSQVSGDIIEFFLPPYFFEEKVTHATAHRRICTMLRRLLDVFAERGYAIVPRHQFRLNDACPSGHWPAISYHTTGNHVGWLHVKDSHIPGYFSMDPAGYSGWSSLADIQKLPETPQNQVDATWEKLQAEFKNKKVSKYDQASNGFIRPARRYVFAPMQLLQDTVAQLSHIRGDILVESLAEMLPALGYDLVIKRHPMCNDARVGKLLADLSGKEGVHVTDASIHEIIPGAAAVIGVNSGVGFEALIYGKKVIMAGRADYAFAGETVHSKAELAEALSRLAQPADIALIKSFLHYYMTEYVFDYEDAESISEKIDKTFSAVDVKKKIA